MNDEVREKYRKLSYQLKDIVTELKYSINDFSEFKKSVNDNYRLDKKIAYKEEFSEIYDINKDILNDMNNIYYIINNKK